MQISEQGKTFIKARESCRLAPHYDAIGGVWDIGYGHVFKDGEPRRSITQDEADALFDLDALYYSDHVNQLVTVALTQGMHDACASILYNVGHETFAQSSVLRFLNAGQYSDAALAFLWFNKARGNFVQGLLNRRALEVLMFSREEYY